MNNFVDKYDFSTKFCFWAKFSWRIENVSRETTEIFSWRAFFMIVSRETKYINSLSCLIYKKEMPIKYGLSMIYSETLPKNIEKTLHRLVYTGF